MVTAEFVVEVTSCDCYDMFSDCCGDFRDGWCNAWCSGSGSGSGRDKFSGLCVGAELCVVAVAIVPPNTEEKPHLQITEKFKQVSLFREALLKWRLSTVRLLIKIACL